MNRLIINHGTLYNHVKRIIKQTYSEDLTDDIRWKASKPSSDYESRLINALCVIPTEVPKE